MIEFEIIPFKIQFTNFSYFYFFLDKFICYYWQSNFMIWVIFKHVVAHCFFFFFFLTGKLLIIYILTIHMYGIKT